MRPARNLAATLLAFALLPGPVLVAQARGDLGLDPQLGSPDGASSAADGSRVLTWAHATSTRRGSLALWGVAERRPIATRPFGPRTERDPGTADLEEYLVGRSTVALHPRGDRALLVRSSSDDRDTGLFELELGDPEGPPRLRVPGRPRAVTWSRDGSHVAWVEQGGSLVLAKYSDDGAWPTVLRHPVDDGVGTFCLPTATTIRWDLSTGSSWTLDLDDPRAPPARSADREWIGRLADGAEVLLDERHVLRSAARVWVDHGFDAEAVDFRGPLLVDAAVSGSRVAWFDSTSRELHVESGVDSASLALGGGVPRWVHGLGAGDFVAATDSSGVFWIREGVAERVAHPGGDLDQIAWSPDGRYLGVAGDAGLAVFDTQSDGRIPARLRQGRHAVAPGSAGSELCVASEAGVGLLDAATGQPVGVHTREHRVGEPVTARPDGPRHLPELLARDERGSNTGRRAHRDRPRRLRLFPLGAERIGLGYAPNRLVLFDPRTGATATRSWPVWSETLLEGIPLAAFEDRRGALVVTITPRPVPPTAYRSSVFHDDVSRTDGNVLVLDADGRPTQVVRLEVRPTAALRERVSGDLLITSESGGIWRGLARLDADSLEVEARYLPEASLVGLAQLADDAVLTWDAQRLIRFDLRLGDAREVELPGPMFAQPTIQAVAVSPDGSRTAVLFGDAAVVLATTRLR